MLEKSLVCISNEDYILLLLFIYIYISYNHNTKLYTGTVRREKENIFVHFYRSYICDLTPYICCVNDTITFIAFYKLDLFFIGSFLWKGVVQLNMTFLWKAVVQLNMMPCSGFEFSPVCEGMGKGTVVAMGT